MKQRSSRNDRCTGYKLSAYFIYLYLKSTKFATEFASLISNENMLLFVRLQFHLTFVLVIIYSSYLNLLVSLESSASSCGISWVSISTYILFQYYYTLNLHRTNISWKSTYCLCIRLIQWPLFTTTAFVPEDVIKTNLLLYRILNEQIDM